jgi:hypothetical protein
MNNFNPGSILINTATNKLYGVLVSILPNNKMIVFRLDKNTHPIFSKFESHPHISKVGIINEQQYSNLKSALLKHYRTYNLTNSEKKMLQPLMNFAFPLGIPEYQPDVELPERDIQQIDLHSKLIPGSRVFINTPNKSCNSHLDNKILTVLDKDENGIWTYLPSSDSDINNLGNKLRYLFYKNNEIPTFGGISRITPIIENTDKLPEVNNVIAEAFKSMKEKDQLITTMEFNGDKVHVVPKSCKIILPEVLQNMTYNPKIDNFSIDPAHITPEMSRKLGDKLMIGGKDKINNHMIFNNIDNEIVFTDEMNRYGNTDNGEQIRINEEGELVYEGGSKKQDSNNSDISAQFDEIDATERELSTYYNSHDENYNIDDIMDDELIEDESMEDETKAQQISKRSKNLIFIDEDEADIEKLFVTSASKKSTSDSDKANNTADTDTEVETDYDEEEIYEIITEDDITDLGTFEKVKRIEVDKLERIYKESIQIGDLYKYKIDQVPYLRRNDTNIINKINKEITIITLLKNQLTNKDNTIKTQPQDYRPLVDKYVQGDFTNKFLIPLVVNRKKIYLDKTKLGQKDEYDKTSHQVIEDYYTDLQEHINLQNKKNISVSNDSYLNTIISEMNPNVVSETDNLGFLFRLGNEINNHDYRKLQQDTLTIKYCDKPYRCQSYTLNPLNFDYQVNLGPMGRFINDEESEYYKTTIDIEEEEKDDDEKIEKSILTNKPYFKTYYDGDLISIIGYVRPPLEYFNNPNKSLLANMYIAKKEHNEVITINLLDINPEIIDENLEEQFNITQHPDKFVLFLLPQEGFQWQKNMAEEVSKIIPNIDDLIKIYLNKTTDNTIENIYNVLEKFEYDQSNMTLELHNKILDKHSELIAEYENYNEKMIEIYNEYTENKNNKNNKNKKNDDSGKDDPKFKYITNDILNDIGKFYFETYENKGINVDSDNTRLRWFMNSFDNGNYFFKTIFMNYLKMYQESHKLENLETELSIMKEKHAINQTNAQLVDSSARINNGVVCENKAKSPNVIKYPSLARLEQDNGKVATDSDGNIIMQGDYALVDVENSKQLYKREIIGNIDMWIKESMETLYKIIQDKKNQCLSNPEIKLEDANKCIFDPDLLKCEPNELLDITKQSLEMELQMNDLQKEIEYIKKIPRIISTLNKEITEDRLVLVNRLNALKRYWSNKEEEEKHLEEIIKKSLITKKPCIHFGITDYFFTIKGYYDDRYKFAQSIFKNFQNNDTKLIYDYNVFDRIHPEHNYTYCNICNQELLCNHFRLGANYLQEGKPINYDNIITVYGSEISGSYYCKVCGESIGTTAILDFDDYAGGDDGYKIKTRELAETTSLIDKQKAYIENMINGILEGEQTIETEDLKRRINIFQLMKRISGLELMNTKDEIDMYNFIKSYNFENKNKILAALVAKLGIGNPVLLNKQVEQVYAKYTIADVAARFLILLQTSSTEYSIINKGCTTNIVGYPLIGDESADDGINYIMCVLTQMSVDKNYTVLSDFKKSFLVDRIRKQVADDSYIKDKIFNALNKKVDNIDNSREFEKYYTNYWKSYRPRMGPININWQPEKILNSANLKEVKNNNLERMIEVGHEDSIYYSLRLINLINNIIDDSDKSNIKGLANFCCLEEKGINKKYHYLDYFKKQNSDINKYLDDIKDIKSVIDKLEEKKKYPILNIIYDPIFKPSQEKLPLSFNVNSDEIKQIYLKFIDSGLNKGKVHIFDKYGRCILSNNKKADIEAKTYSNQDYKRIEEAINSGNEIDIKKYIIEDETVLDMNLLEIKYLDTIIDAIPKLDIMKYITDFIMKMKNETDNIFGKTETKKNEKFNINRHLTMLNSQIQIEIDNLVRKITATEKNIDKYSKIMYNLGDYKNLYDEYKETHTVEESEIYRYNNKEDNIHYTIKFLNDIINQIKNNKLSNALDKDVIRPQYRNFLGYGDNVKLFKMLGESVRQIYNFSKLLKSKQIFKMLFPEMVSAILQYLNIISLVNMFDILDTSKIGKKKVDEIKYNFYKPVEPDEALRELNREMDIGNEYLDEDEGIDFIESFEIKNSDNLKAIAGFITTYLDKVDDLNNTYDTLTKDYINIQVTEHEQKHIENTLKSFEWLAKEGHEVERQLAFIKLNKLKKIDYANITEYLITEYGNDMFNETDKYDSKPDLIISEGDDQYQGQNLGKNEDLGLDDYEMGEMGEVFDTEDMEDVDQDYGMLAIN